MENILSTLNTVSLKLLGTLSLEETYQIIVDEAKTLASANDGTIFLENNGSFKRVFSSLPSYIQTAPRKRGYVYKSFTEGKIVIVPRTTISSIHPEMRDLDSTTVIMIPLTHRGKSIGVLNLHTKIKHTFSQSEIEVFKIFASMASLAIQSSRAHEETKHALEIRDFFIALAGHELRTPLTVINGYAGLLKNKIDKKLPIEKKWITQLEWESNRLTHLVHEMLEINQVRAGKLDIHLQQMEIKNIMNKSVQEFQTTYPERKIEYIDGIKLNNAYIIGDEKKLVRVFNGLLDNAAKFSEKDQKITIRLKFMKDFYVIIIKDTGKGIKKEDLTRIFDGFYKTADNTKEGMGLGLFLAKYIINKHNGSIDIQSEFNRGTTVTVVLPKHT